MVKNKEELLTYPVLVSEMNDDGNYFLVETPDIPGMVTSGKTLKNALYWSEDAIATLIYNDDIFKDNYPETSDPKEWKLKKNQTVHYVKVDLKEWGERKGGYVSRHVTLPEYLNIYAKKNKLNVSKILADAISKISS